MRQMDRRLLILMRLREEAAVRAQDMAEDIGCSVRTIYRDIEALCEAGVPVAAMPGEGYRLVPGYHLPPVAFTAEEAIQLLLGADLALGLGTSSQREAVRSAAAKVETVLKPETRLEVGRMRDRIRISNWMRREPSPWLPALHEAVTEDRVLFLRYHSFGPGEVTERRVEPHGLTYYGNDWHLVAYCRLREGMRDFRASRILDARVLPETFERLAAFDWFSDDPPDEKGWSEVRVWIDSPVVTWARETAAFGFQREEQGEGGSTFVFHNRDLRRLLPWVLSWGASARVTSPLEVAARVAAEAIALAKRYDDR